MMFYLQTLSESTTRLSDAVRDAHSQIAWENIRGFRNRIAHEYLTVNLNMVWLIATTELTSLKEVIDSLLASLPADEDAPPTANS